MKNPACNSTRPPPNEHPCVWFDRNPDTAHTSPIKFLILTLRWTRIRGSGKGADTVGQPPSAENGASHMPSLQTQEHGESGTVTAPLWHGNRMTNSIGAVSRTPDAAS